MLYGDWIGRWASAYPNAEALVDLQRSRHYTHRELADDINRMAHFLASLDVAKGDRVAVLSRNRAEYIVLCLAAGRIGAVTVPLNCRLAANEFPYYLEDSGPKALFYDKEHLDLATELKENAQIDHFICFDEDDTLGKALPMLWNALPSDCHAPVSISPRDPHLIIYTSGTTGLPKGVILTHGMITWNSINTIIGWGLQRGERTILHSPLFYTAGWNIFTFPLFHSCGTNILIDRFDPDLVLDLIQREHITVFFGVPTSLQMMIESPKFAASDLSSIRFIVSGGAPLTEEIFDAFKERKGIHLREGYGLTEAGPNNFMANGKLKTVGHPMPHVDIKLINAEGNEVSTGQEGELLLRGDHVSPGYWNKPEETTEAMRDGWLHTGDIARIDEDGHVAIVGRKKDMFISGGINVYPAEIERVINTHPHVTSTAVIGVPDDKWGEVGKAFVELQRGEHLTLEALQTFLSGRIAKYKIPKYMTVLDELPRTSASGKVQKFVLKKKHGNADNR